MFPRLILSGAIAVLTATTVLAADAQANNKGQDDLDLATEAKLSAQSLGDLAKVISLVESSLEKGLDKDNKEFAENLLVSTLLQRGTMMTAVIFKKSPPDARWPQFRNVALTDLERVLKLNDKLPKPYYLVARLNLLPGGDRKKVVEALNKAIELTEDERMKADALLLRAGLEKDSKKKLADLNEAVRLAPQNPAAIRTRALVLADAKKYDLAITDLDKSIELAPDYLPGYEAKALVLVAAGKHDEALKTLDMLSKKKPGLVFPLVQKAKIHVGRKDFKAALVELNKALKIAPTNGSVLLVRSGIHQEMGEKEKALADVDEALKLRPDWPNAMRVRSMLLADSGKVTEAIAEMEKLHKSQPKDLMALLQLAMLYTSEKKFDKAVEAYAEILDAVPDSWAALRGRGDAFLNNGKQVEAIADYEKAIKLKPDDPGILNNLAWVLATSPNEKLRDGQRAVKLATKACELTDHKMPHILSTLAAACAEAGDFDAAVKWAKKGADLSEGEVKEHVNKELENYKKRKPWRELLKDGEPVQQEN